MPPPKAKRVPLRLTKRPLPLRWHMLISAPGLSPISAMRLAKSGVPFTDTTRTGVCSAAMLRGKVGGVFMFFSFVMMGVQVSDGLVISIQKQPFAALQYPYSKK
jgi:hypothetical protein